MRSLRCAAPRPVWAPPAPVCVCQAPRGKEAAPRTEASSPVQGSGGSEAWGSHSDGQKPVTRSQLCRVIACVRPRARASACFSGNLGLCPLAYLPGDSAASRGPHTELGCAPQRGRDSRAPRPCPGLSPSASVALSLVGHEWVAAVAKGRGDGGGGLASQVTPRVESRRWGPGSPLSGCAGTRRLDGAGSPADGQRGGRLTCSRHVVLRTRFWAADTALCGV